MIGAAVHNGDLGEADTMVSLSVPADSRIANAAIVLEKHPMQQHDVSVTRSYVRTVFLTEV